MKKGENMIDSTLKTNHSEASAMQQLARPQDKTNIPPIKIQGIKSKLVQFIRQNIGWADTCRWAEPFLGSGVVMFNMSPSVAMASDLNPHIIKMYESVQNHEITPASVKKFLETEGSKLSIQGEQYYYEVRDRFNSNHESLDFLFLNRAGFNGLVRFNSKGGFNTPFCRKPHRFSKSYITKISNQVKWLYDLFRGKKWTFRVMNWKDALKDIKDSDFMYLDPPYAGRHTTYYDKWDEFDMRDLAKFLRSNNVKFAFSLWYENKYRRNDDIDRYFSEFTIKKHEHFYHVGSTEDLRNSMTEALIMRL